MTNPLPERYADAELVARGGMGEVWRALDTHLDRLVAVKLLHDGAGHEPQETLRVRFQREAQSVARLSSHPRIVTVFDVGETEAGVPYMTMQWLGGGTLPVDRASADWHDRDAVRWLGHAASGLDAAHRASIVHRDVKPSNILLDEEGDAYVGDFGIAQVQHAGAGELTQTGALIGTASYMSPEQASGAPAEPASDQYALASIAYEMLVGSRPFTRDSPVAELAAHVSEPVPAASLRRTDLPPAVDAVFARALAKQPGERYLTCSAFVEELRAALAAPIRSTTDPAAATTRVSESPALAPVEATRVMPTARSRRSSRLVPVVVLVAIAVVGGITLALMDDDRDPAADQAQDATPATPATTTTPAKSPPTDTSEPTKSAPAPVSRDAAIAQHLRSFQLLQQRRYAEALTEGTAALAHLGGVTPYEAFANYNVGASLVGLGRCDEALPYLDRSEQLQGSRKEIREARKQCTRGGAGGGKDRGGNEGDDDD